METIIKVDQLTKTYKKQNHFFKALDKVSFCLGAQEVLGVMGESGCGKTTLLNILAGMETPSSGSIWLQEGLTMHMVFQNPAASFNPRMTIGRSLSEGLINKKVPLAQREKILQELLQQCGLDNSYLTAYPQQLSGGQCQRAALVRALACSPQVLLCDEMTSSLDTITKKQILELVQALCQQRAMSVIIVDHDTALLAALCSRILVMREGHLIDRGTVEEILPHS